MTGSRSWNTARDRTRSAAPAPKLDRNRPHPAGAPAGFRAFKNFIL